jgi:hypothetical protein
MALLFLLHVLGTVQAEVVISEVADKGTTGMCDGNDWVELYNGGNTAVAIAGYVLYDDKGPTHSGALVFGEGVDISAGGYLVSRL